MQQIFSLDSVDYLVFGHLTRDLNPKGARLGGTAAYAALTAQAMGLRVGIVTSWGADLPLGPLKNIPIINFPTEASTTFKNIVTSAGRTQYIYNKAAEISLYLVPQPWRTAKIVHLGPVAQEVAPALVRQFPTAFIGVTPQGWLRSVHADGLVTNSEWPESQFVLHHSGAAVVSFEDLGGDEARIEELATAAKVLAVTEAEAGARVYWKGDIRHFSPPQVELIDDTGAGDIFAAAFFIRLYWTRDPWEATRFATQLAAFSVTRPGLTGIPTAQEIEATMAQIHE